jgi:hypothetical protein
MKQLNKSLDPSIFRIRIGLLLIAGAMSFGALVVQFWIPLAALGLGRTAQGIQLASTRMSQFNEGLAAALAIHAAAQAKPINTASLAQNRALLASAIFGIRSAQQELSAGGAWYGADAATFEGAAKITLFHARNSGFKPTRWSFSEAMDIATANLLFILDHNATEGLTTQALEELVLSQESLLGAQEEAIALRHAEVVKFGLDTPFLMGVIGSLFVLFTVALSIGLFFLPVLSLAQRQTALMELFLVVPASAAGSLRTLLNAQLDIVMAEEVVEQPADVAGPSIAGGDANLSTAGPSMTAGSLDEMDDAELQRLSSIEDDRLKEWQSTLDSLRPKAMLAAASVDEAGLPHIRQYRDTSPFVTNSLAWLILPLCLVVVWTIVVVTQAYDSFGTAVERATRISSLATAANSLQHAVTTTQTLLLMSNASAADNFQVLLPSRGGPLTHQALLVNATDSLASTSQAFRELLRGSTACSSAGSSCFPVQSLVGRSSHTLYPLFFQDACTGVPQPPLEPACPHISLQVLQEGVEQGTNALLATISSLILTDIPLQGDAPRLQQLGTHAIYLARAMQQAIRDMGAASFDWFTGGAAFSTSFSWSFALGYAGVITTWYWIASAQLSLPLQSTRELVRLIPLDLAAVLPELLIRLRLIVGNRRSGVGRARRRLCCCGRRPKAKISDEVTD